MTVLEMSNERRRSRSKQAIQAIMLQLEHIYSREKLRNFTLGDSRGLVIASAGEQFESDALAAYAPLLARCVDRQCRQSILANVDNFVPGVDERSLHVRTFEIDGEELYLSLVGQPGVYQHVGLYRAITGVRRIFRQSALAA
ncbi:MAG: hypothetical protein H0U74_20625 [Bradymonadaceae bacterium]|nr:hypothetical protein [Lujinxingiaceae bacterium]